MVCEFCAGNPDSHIKCVAIVSGLRVNCDCQHGGDDPEALKEDCSD